MLCYAGGKMKRRRRRQRRGNSRQKTWGGGTAACGSEPCATHPPRELGASPGTCRRRPSPHTACNGVDDLRRKHHARQVSVLQRVARARTATEHGALLRRLSRLAAGRPSRRWRCQNIPVAPAWPAGNQAATKQPKEAARVLGDGHCAAGAQLAADGSVRLLWVPLLPRFRSHYLRQLGAADVDVRVAAAAGHTRGPSQRAARPGLLGQLRFVPLGAVAQFPPRDGDKSPPAVGVGAPTRDVPARPARRATPPVFLAVVAAVSAVLLRPPPSAKVRPPLHSHPATRASGTTATTACHTPCVAPRSAASRTPRTLARIVLAPPSHPPDCDRGGVAAPRGGTPAPLPARTPAAPGRTEGPELCRGSP
eukprot:ctg_1007.g419